MMHWDDIINWLGLSGVVSLVLGAVSYGGLAKQVQQNKSDIEDIKRSDTSLENGKAIASLEAKFEERTNALLREVTGLRSDLKEAMKRD